MSAQRDHGVAQWSSPAWRTAAVAWADEQLARAGLERTGEAEQPRVRPWGTVLRIPASKGPVWLKATAPATAFEVPLYAALAGTAPERVLVPLAADTARGWLLLPDGGPALRERLGGEGLLDALAAALVEYGRLQRRLASRADELVALGVPDMRPARMPARFDEALDAAGAAADGTETELVERIAEMRPALVAWCAELAASGLPASLDHNDLHPGNVLGDGAAEVRYYDWGDAVVAHPFAVALVPLWFLHGRLEGGLDDPRFLRARDRYLDLFADLAPRPALADTLALACRVAKVARALTWERALRAAREQGEGVDPAWARAPLTTLAAILDDSYLALG